jgi:hypothetical protein
LLARNQPLTAVVFGDTHFPFQDDRALRAVLSIIRAVKPQVVVHLGDLLDSWQLSRFDKDPARRDSLQENIKEAREFLAAVRRAAPKAECTLLEGNHEDRLRRAIWQARGTQREIVSLDDVREAAAWPSLLKLKSMSWDWVPYMEQAHRPVLPKIITKHGTVVSRWSGVTAKTEWMRYGKSGISGHTHRAGIFYHRDHNGQAVWIEAGCTCSLTNVQYGSDFDWQQACVLLHWSGDRRLMAEQVIRIRDGEFVQVR